MRILLRFELDCPPDDAWHAIRSPEVFQQVSFPLTTFSSLERDGFPVGEWPEGEHLVAVKALGLVDVGRQVIAISHSSKDDALITHDDGWGVSGPLSLVTRWNHRMAVSPLPDGRTLYRDELRFSAGPATLLLWPMFWAFWQWRGFGIRRLAPSWRGAWR
jgi:hypothetical protein